MNNFTTTIVSEVTAPDEKGVVGRHVDEAGRPLYKIVIREDGAFVTAINLPHAALVSLVQTTLSQVPADDPLPPLIVPPPRYA